MGRSQNWMSNIEVGRTTLFYSDAFHLARILGVPMSAFAPSGSIPAIAAPRTLPEWKALYTTNEPLAHAHWSLDQMWRSTEETALLVANREARMRT